MGSHSEIQRQQTACQELLKKDGLSCSGFLREMTALQKLCEAMDQKMNRRGFSQRLTSLLSCEVCYVVIYEGFLFVYKSETANKPSKVLDLCAFQRVEKDENLRIKGLPWPFKISSDDTNVKALYFGASSEPELKKWIEAAKKGIEEAKQSGRKPVIVEKKLKQSERQQLRQTSESNVKKDKDLPITDSAEAAGEAIYPLNSERDCADSDSDDGFDYEKLDEDLVKEATWTGPLDEAIQIMKSAKEDGIFMIRESTAGKGEQTLQVKSDVAVRKYRITKEGDELRMAGGGTFKSMTELLSFYQKNSIPNHSTKLTKPYSKVFKV